MLINLQSLVLFYINYRSIFNRLILIYLLPILNTHTTTITTDSIQKIYTMRRNIFTLTLALLTGASSVLAADEVVTLFMPQADPQPLVGKVIATVYDPFLQFSPTI